MHKADRIVHKTRPPGCLILPNQLKSKKEIMETLLEAENLVARPKFKDHYDNFIGGKWIPSAKGQTFDNIFHLHVERN